MIHRILLATIAATILLALPGCNSCGKCRLFGGRGLFNRSDNNARLEAPAPTRGTVDPFLIPPPQGGLPTTGLDGPPVPRGTAVPSDIPPASIPENRSYKSNDKELLLPDPLPGESSSKSKTPNRNMPGFLESPAEVRPGNGTTSAKPAVKNPNVPGFAKAIDGVSTGRKPTVDGFETLAQSGYKTVIYLHAEGVDVSPAKALAEKRNLNFESISVTPENLKTSYAKFIELIAEGKAKPIYVFDDDGVRTGSLWHIHFVTAERMADDAAQVRAAPLGLRDANDTTFKLAVKEYLLKN